MTTFSSSSSPTFPIYDHAHYVTFYTSPSFLFFFLPFVFSPFWPSCGNVNFIFISSFLFWICLSSMSLRVVLRSGPFLEMPFFIKSFYRRSFQLQRDIHHSDRIHEHFLLINSLFYIFFSVAHPTPFISHMWTGREGSETQVVTYGVLVIKRWHDKPPTPLVTRVKRFITFQRMEKRHRKCWYIVQNKHINVRLQVRV